MHRQSEALDRHRALVGYCGGEEMVRLVVTGGRVGRDAGLVDRRLSAVHAKHGIDVLIVGRASGYDTLCEDWAKDHCIPVLPFPAQWDDIHHPGAVVRTNRYGKKYDVTAGGRRNQQMIDEGRPDAAVQFPGGSGTADMVKRLEKAGIPCWLYPT